MRKSVLRLYAPFIALATLQAAFVIAAPSKGEAIDPLAGLQQPLTAGSPTAEPVSGQPAPTVDPAAGAPAPAGTDPTSTPVGAPEGGATPAPGTPAGGQQQAAPAPTAAGDTPAPPPDPAGSPAAATGDTSHCVNGRQSDVISTAPPCAPTFTGDNGGATYRGVTATEIKFTYFQCQPNEQVDAILATQGLAASQEETDAMIQAAVDWMNGTYEFYGRQIVWDHVIGDCTLTPPDPAKARQAAAEVAKTDPFLVVHYSGGPTTHDVWAQNGIISIGGPTQDRSFFAGRRPFRWDVFPDGTETADWIGEYACQKLAGKSASHAGRLIHPSIGGRDTTRKFAVLTFDNGHGNTLPNGKNAKRLLEQCSGSEVPLLLYESDINRAEEQTRTIVAKLIDEKVTTIICLCDAIAPTFLTNGLTRNSYFPEHMLSGAYLMDYDILGRLYDPAQWQHAFGPSQLAEPVDHSKSNATKIWKAAGRSGEPCDSCNLVTGYMTLLGSMIQAAGPNLNPLTVEQGLVGARSRTGGWAELQDPHEYLIKFGPDDYNAISDFREVYWSSTATSKIDGKQGAYVSLNGGRRYEGGQLDGSFDVPVPAQ